jgi:hypothetical protein
MKKKKGVLEVEAKVGERSQWSRERRREEAAVEATATPHP